MALREWSGTVSGGLLMGGHYPQVRKKIPSCWKGIIPLTTPILPFFKGELSLRTAQHNTYQLVGNGRPIGPPLQKRGSFSLQVCKFRIWRADRRVLWG